MNKTFVIISMVIGTILLLVAISYGVLWLGILFLILCLTYLVFRKLRKLNLGLRFNVFLKIIGWFVAFVLILCLGVSLRLLFIEVYAIPSGSMKDALIPGDKIVVNKLAYGPVLPRSPIEIPWVNLLVYLSLDDQSDIEEDRWGYNRLQGFSSILAGDILVFKKNRNNPISFIKRCAATPGDTLKIVDAMPLIEESTVPWFEHTLVPIDIWSSDEQKLVIYLDSLKLRFSSPRGYSSDSSKTPVSGKVEYPNLKVLNDLDMIDSITVTTKRANSNYLKSIDSTWTIYNFGPIIVPKKGMTIPLNNKTFATYSKLFNPLREGVKIKRNGAVFELEGREIKNYTFQKDYYFMMGDNRADSRDSRYISFISEDNIIGRADLILFSNKYDFQWDRFFKLL